MGKDWLIGRALSHASIERIVVFRRLLDLCVSSGEGLGFRQSLEVFLVQIGHTPGCPSWHRS